MDIDNYKCPICNQSIAPWVVRQLHFECLACKKQFQSNYKSSLKRSALFGAGVWIAAASSGCYFYDPWQVALAMSVEFGGVGAFVAAVIFHRFYLRIKAT